MCDSINIAKIISGPQGLYFCAHSDYEVRVGKHEYRIAVWGSVLAEFEAEFDEGKFTLSVPLPLNRIVEVVYI